MTCPTKNIIERKDESAKLVSLLALATGAVAMPQTGNADIIFTGLSEEPKHVGYANGYDAFFNFTLPGTAQFGFKRTQQTGSTTIGIYYYYTQTILAGKMGGVGTAGLQAAGGFAVPLNAGQAWDQGVGTFQNAAIGIATTSAHLPNNNYDHKYLAWLFSDTTQNGDFRYGWVEVSLSISDLGPLNNGGPNVTIWGYAYDDTGAQPTMGQMPVPEPSSAGLIVLGALALGATGLRRWRRNRVAGGKS